MTTSTGTKKTKAAKTAKAVKIAKVTKLIYVGPPMKDGQIMRYSIFIGGYPANMERLEAMYPKIRRLFVPLEKLEKAEADIRKKGTPLNLYFCEAMEV